MKKKYDLMVIGGGTAGLRAALRAVSHGHKTILIEPYELGGTCLNKGCIPTKAMLYASELYKKTLNLKKYGIETSNVKINFPKLMDRVCSIIDEGQVHIKKSVKNCELEIVKEKAVFVNKDTVKAGKREISARKIIICTGAKTFVPPIKGIDKVEYMISDDAVKLRKLPKSIVIIGGGYISMEFARFFNQLGSKVTILERESRILGILDDDIAEALHEFYSEEKVNIVTNANILEVRKGQVIINDVRYPKSKKKTIIYDKILVAAGRMPNSKELNLEAAGIKTGKRGDILINDYLQTTNSKVYAIGDVNGKAMFAHAAKRETKIAIENALHYKKEKMGFDLMPWAMFSDPPISGIGLNEAQAKEKGFRTGILKADFSRAGRATVNGDTRGFVKVIYNKFNKKILGCFIIGPNADDLIHEFVAVMNSKSPTIDVIRKTIHVHPTLSEVMESLC